MEALMSMLNNVVGYWAYIRGTYIWGLIFGWAYIRGAYIWNEVSVSICDGLIFGGGTYIGGGTYSRRFTVVEWCCMRKKYGSIPAVVETILINSTRDKKELSRIKNKLKQV